MSDALHKKLNALDKETLIEILSEISSSGKDGKKLISTWLNIRDPKAMHKELKKEINAIKRGKRFIDYRSMPSFAERLFSISEKMKKYMLSSEANLTLDLCKQLIEIDESLFERADDSSGELGSFYHDLFEILDKAFGASNESAEEIVTYILEISSKDDYGNRSSLVEQLNFCLKDEVMSCFKERLELISHEELQTQIRDGSWSEVQSSLISLSILKKIADKKQDIDEYIRLSQLGIFDDRSICKIAKRLNAAFRTEEAIVWLNTINSPELFREKSQLLQEAYHLDGDQEKEKQVIWERFTRNVGISDYLAYLKILPDVDRDEAKKKAYQIAVEKNALEQGLKFLWDLGDFEMVEQTYFNRLKEVNDRSFSFYRKLSTALYQNGHPLSAVVMRRELIDHVLCSGISKYYRYAVSDLNQMEKYAKDIKEWKGIPSNTEFLNGLYKEHHRKYSFWEHIDYQSVPLRKERMGPKKRSSLPPHSLEAEVNLLSGLLYNKNAWATLSSHLHRELFYCRPFRYVFDALAALLTFNDDVNYQMLMTELRKREVFDVEVFDYQLQEIEQYKINAANVTRFAEIVIEQYHQREIWLAENEVPLND